MRLLAAEQIGENEAMIFFRSSYRDLELNKNVTHFNAHHAIFDNSGLLLTVQRIVEEFPGNLFPNAVLEKENQEKKEGENPETNNNNEEEKKN